MKNTNTDIPTEEHRRNTAIIQMCKKTIFNELMKAKLGPIKTENHHELQAQVSCTPKVIQMLMGEKEARKGTKGSLHEREAEVSVGDNDLCRSHSLLEQKPSTFPKEH